MAMLLFLCVCLKFDFQIERAHSCRYRKLLTFLAKVEACRKTSRRLRPLLAGICHNMHCVVLASVVNVSLAQHALCGACVRC
jgi:hypothetical protein